jgi:XTP/dITP diphosphohydrolase
MQQLLVATNNPHKLKELELELRQLELRIFTPGEVGVPPEFDVEETGTTFAENAELKARAFAVQTGLPSLADDSGLVVEALGGEPGVHSKRWIEGSDHDRNVHLLKKLEGESDRSAHFVTVLALYLPDPNQFHFFEGSVSGKIGAEERGSQGFGYDPLFIPDGYTQSFGELDLEVKSTLSHRHRALEKLRQYLEKESSQKE